MSKYIITQADKATIEANESRPKRHEFWYLDDNWKYYFDDSVVEHYDFDYNSIFQTEMWKTLDEYLQWLEKVEDLETSFEQRKKRIDDLVLSVNANPLIDNEQTLNILTTYEKEVRAYIYFGDKDTLINKLTDDKDNNTNGFQSYLNGYTDDEQTITVYQAILWTIQ